MWERSELRHPTSVKKLWRGSDGQCEMREIRGSGRNAFVMNDQGEDITLRRSDWKTG